MTILGIAGMNHPAAVDAVVAALRSCDAQARIRPDMKAGIVDVDSVLDPSALCDALQRAGYVAAPLAHRPGLIGVANLLGLFGRALLWGLGGVAVGSVVGLAVMLLIVSILPECRSGGDEGACAMGIPVGMAEMAAIGGSLAFLLTLLRGGYRLYRIWRAG